MRRLRSTRILATLGPASSEPEMIRRLYLAGADVFRLNFSHGSQEDHRKRAQAIRALEDELKRPIGLLADLQGPKIRVGVMAGEEAMLETSARFRLDLDKTPGDSRRAPLPHPPVFEALEKGAELLLDDGRIRLKVEKAGADFAETRVLAGGKLKSRKGVNVPNAVLAIAALTAKDRSDLAFALDLGVDWVALSFVQRPDDVAEAKKLIGGRAAVMAKIEKPAALERIEEILELADAIMVARGDLGRSCAARRAGKPVVVATQMLESMVSAPVPTRAEVSDVATAVYDGADAVMLSAETASGANPEEAVRVMSRVAEKVERDPLYRPIMEAEHANPEATAADAITAAARQVADTISAAAIVTYTFSGSTALRAARERPRSPILALTPRLDTARRLAITWGLHCVQTEDATSFADMVDRATKIAREEEFADAGSRIVVTAGVPFGTPGATNILRIAWVPRDAEAPRRRVKSGRRAPSS